MMPMYIASFPVFYLSLFSAASKKHSADLKRRNVDQGFTVPLFDNYLSNWLKDAPKRLKNEEKRNRSLECDDSS